MNLWNLKKKSLWTKLDGDELYEEFQKIYDESAGRNVDKERVEDKMWDRKVKLWF